MHRRRKPGRRPRRTRPPPPIQGENAPPLPTGTLSYPSPQNPLLRRLPAPTTGTPVDWTQMTIQSSGQELVSTTHKNTGKPPTHQRPERVEKYITSIILTTLITTVILLHVEYLLIIVPQDVNQTSHQLVSPPSSPPLPQKHQPNYATVTTSVLPSRGYSA